MLLNRSRLTFILTLLYNYLFLIKWNYCKFRQVFTYKRELSCEIKQQINLTTFFSNLPLHKMLVFYSLKLAKINHLWQHILNTLPDWFCMPDLTIKGVEKLSRTVNVLIHLGAFYPSTPVPLTLQHPAQSSRTVLSCVALSHGKAMTSPARQLFRQPFLFARLLIYHLMFFYQQLINQVVSFCFKETASACWVEI